jgi:predicted dehydrogenase
MVTRTVDALDLMGRAERAGVLLAVGFNRHVDPANLYARDLIRRGTLGEVWVAEALQLGYPGGGWYTTRALGGGGPLTGRGTHMADLICWYTGWRPERVTATLTGALDEVEAGGTFVISFAGGRQCSVTSARAGHRDVDRMVVYGSEGAVEVLRPLGWQYRWDVRHYGRGGEPLDVPELPDGSTTAANFVDAILGRVELSGTALDGARATQIVEAAYESGASGRSVELADLPDPRRAADRGGGETRG